MRLHWKLAGLALAAAIATGCERADARRAAGQVVAKVNGIEISAPQAASAQALEQVIERELLVQQALAGGLERDPLVARSIDNARRQILAQAYLERAALAGAKSTPQEARAFYEGNPALFGERRIYRLQELAVSEPANIDLLRHEVQRAASLDGVAAWLRSRNAKFSAASLTQPAEQLPLRYLPKLAEMKPGEIAVFASPEGASVVQLVHAEDAPLTEQQAAPAIEQFLAGRKRLEVAAAEVRRLRESARIEYVGESKAR